MVWREVKTHFVCDRCGEEKTNVLNVTRLGAVPQDLMPRDWTTTMQGNGSTDYRDYCPKCWGLKQ
jgi:hypothetical protein